MHNQRKTSHPTNPPPPSYMEPLLSLQPISEKIHTRLGPHVIHNYLFFQIHQKISYLLFYCFNCNAFQFYPVSPTEIVSNAAIASLRVLKCIRHPWELKLLLPLNYSLEDGSTLDGGVGQPPSLGNARDIGRESNQHLIACGGYSWRQFRSAYPQHLGWSCQLSVMNLFELNG